MGFGCCYGKKNCLVDTGQYKREAHNTKEKHQRYVIVVTCSLKGQPQRFLIFKWSPKSYSPVQKNVVRQSFPMYKW
jgi:hypothetical protein